MLQFLHNHGRSPGSVRSAGGSFCAQQGTSCRLNWGCGEDGAAPGFVGAVSWACLTVRAWSREELGSCAFTVCCLCPCAEHRVQERHAVPRERPARCAGVPALAPRQGPRGSEQRGEFRRRASGQGKGFAGSQRGRVAVALHTVSLFKLDLHVGFSTLIARMEQKLGLGYCLFLAL